jgi:hypothetical protein
MTSNIPIRTAKDGSENKELGYHGWVVALMDNTTIME